MINSREEKSLCMVWDLLTEIYGDQIKAATFTVVINTKEHGLGYTSMTFPQSKLDAAMLAAAQGGGV